MKNTLLISAIHHRHFAVCLAALLASGSALSQMKNGMPCIGGVFIGDTVESLMDTRFEPVMVLAPNPALPNVSIKTTRANEVDIKWLKKDIIASHDVVATLATYRDRFDNDILPVFQEITVYCGNAGADVFRGVFRSEGGHKTTVRIGVIQTDKALKPRMGVSAIARDFVGVTTVEQQKELERQIFEAYKAMGYGPKADTPAKFAVHSREKQMVEPVSSNWVNGMSPSLQFAAPHSWTPSADQLYAQKECGGTTKVINLN